MLAPLLMEWKIMLAVSSPETLIIPGLAGSPEGHWQHVWSEDRDNARFVVQDNWDTPDIQRWKARLEQALMETDGAYLVAHSLGCVLVAKMIDSAALGKIRGALLVAPCDLSATESIHPRLISFGDMPETKLPFPSVLVGSRNDPYMSEERSRHFAEAWGSRFVDMGYVGHINRASGFGRFNRGYQLFDNLVASAEHRRPSFKAGGSNVAGVDPEQLVKLRAVALAQF